MNEKRFKMGESDIQGEMTFIDTQTNKIYWQEYFDEIVDLVNEQQDTIEKQKRIIKNQDAEISRQYNLCLEMNGILREEFGVYDVFDRTKDKNIKKEDD